MILIKTKDIRTVLYSVAKQLKNNDAFRFVVMSSWTSVLQLNNCIAKNEIVVIKELAKIRKIIVSGKNISLFINGVKICDIKKESDEVYVVEDCCGKLLEYIFFELIGECNKVKVKLSKVGVNNYHNIGYVLDATYLREHIIDVENIYDTFSDLSKEFANKLKSSIAVGEEYNVIMVSRIMKSNSQKYCSINFEFNITM